jgi:hypothetical protein
MFLSAAGPLALGPLAAAGLRGTAWYSFAVYFYLHFQANGWFVFLLLEPSLHAVATPADGARRSVQLLAAGCVTTLALSTLWMNPPAWVRGVGIAGSGLQLVAATRLGRAIWPHPAWASAPARILYQFGLGVLAAKFVLQFLAGWPGLVEIATLRPSIIGFLHLVFLGAITPLLLAWALEHGWLRWRQPSRIGIGLLVAGTGLTEAVLFSPAVAVVLDPGAGWPRFAETLVVAAVLMVTGIIVTALGFARVQRAQAELKPETRKP